MATFRCVQLLVLAVTAAAQSTQVLQELSNTLLLNQLAISNVLAEKDSSIKIIRQWLDELQSNITSECRRTRGQEELDSRSALECVRPFTVVHDRCIMVESQRTGNWGDMKKFCQQQGGKMVKVDTDNFMYHLVRFLHDNGLNVKNYWVGGSDEGSEGVFFWNDGTRVKMGTPFWGDGTGDQIQEPDGGATQNCIIMYKDDHYFFFDLPCHDSQGVICERM